MVESPIKSSSGKHSILTESQVTEVLLLHPSALGGVKKEVGRQLKRKVGQWDPERNGVLVAFQGKKEVLNGGRGKVVDTSPYVHLVVRYTGLYARPEVGAKLVGNVQAVTVH